MIYMFNFLLAAIWLILGIGLLVYDRAQPGGASSFRVGDTDISLGWVALILAGYNVFRGWSRRMALQTRRQREELERRRETARREREFRDAGRQPDPNF